MAAALTVQMNTLMVQQNALFQDHLVMAGPSSLRQKSTGDTKWPLRALFKPLRRAFTTIRGWFRRGPRHTESKMDPGHSNDVGGDTAIGTAETT